AGHVPEWGVGGVLGTSHRSGTTTAVRTPGNGPDLKHGGVAKLTWSGGRVPPIRWPLDQYGVEYWVDMFTPRQLLGHATLVKHLKAMTPTIIGELGPERGKAIVTYLQFAIDKGMDYNSKQTRWIPQRGIVTGTFSRHDFSLKWTFGEMI